MLETNVGSEIIPFVTDLLRVPDGVTRPGPDIGVVRPLVVMPVSGFGEGIAEEVGDMGVASCEDCIDSDDNWGLGDGRGEGLGVEPSPMFEGANGLPLYRPGRSA